MPLNINGSVISGSTIQTFRYNSIVKKNLIFHLDGNKIDSYPTSGTSWYDLSDNNYIGTLTNGPTYSSTNGGCVVFDGTNDYVELNTTSIISGNQSFTIEAFYTITGSGGGAIFSNYNASYQTNTIWFSAQYGIYINAACYVATAPITSGTHHMVATRDSNGVVKVYLDGVLSNTVTLNASISNSLNYRIGTDAGNTSEPFTGNLYNMRVYNRDLSINEILQNYNSQKNRFGI
jgi:hypothetical protein